jgi:hypothetical protein
MLTYKVVNGRNVIESGFVVVEGVEHYVKGGFVACDSRLNRRAWNTTAKVTTCNYCKRFKIERPVQLKLF